MSHIGVVNPQKNIFVLSAQRVKKIWTIEQRHKVASTLSNTSFEQITPAEAGC